MWVTFTDSELALPARLTFSSAHLQVVISSELNGINGPNVRREILRKTRAIKQCRDSRFLHEACRVKSQSAQGAGLSFDRDGLVLLWIL